MTPFVHVEELFGRDEELARIERLIADATEAPQLLLLEGDPGIGKTSLWRAGVELARDRDFRILSARPAEPEAALSFAALGDLLGETADDIGALPEPQRRALRVALLLEEHDGTAIDARAVSVALLRLLRELAREAPVFVAVDDVQWLDAATAAALTFALRRADAGPLAFLGTARPGQARLDVERLQSSRVLPLGTAAIESIVRQALDAPLVRPLVRRVSAASGGNPFYAVELARTIVDDAGHIDLTNPIPLPESLADLLRARLAALPPSSRHALAAVSALAQPTRALVEQAVGRDARGLEPALQAGIVAFEDEAVRFTHPLLASAAYSQMTQKRRRALHRQLADVVTDPEEQARHLALAVEPPDAAVGSALEQAAVGAFDRGATENAAELMQHALRFTPGDAFEALQRRRLAAVGYLARTGAKTRARELLDEARLAGSSGPDLARIALTATWFGIWDAASCIRALRNAVEDARDEPLLLVKVHCALVPMLLSRPDLAGAEHHAAVALELAEEIGDEAHLVLALVGVVHTAWLSGRRLELELAQRAAALEERAGNPYGNVGVAAFFVGSLLALTGDFDAARGVLEAKAAEERRRGDIGVGRTLAELASAVEIPAGNWERAQELAEESLELAREVGDVVVQAFAQRELTRLAVLRGEAERGRELAAEGLHVSDAAGTPFRRIQILTDLGLLELSLGNPEAAAARCEDAARFVADAGFGDPDSLSFVPDQVEALIALDDLGGADIALTQFESRARQLDLKAALAAALRCRGELAAAHGDLDAAAETLAEARAAAAKLGWPFEHARTLLAEGTILRQARRIADARDTLNQALSLFEELGAALWARHTKSELARLGGRPSHGGDLTATEQQIAELVAVGKSNAEVARALHLSPKTVEWNLSKIYRKLRVSSRAELAARYAERSGDAARTR